MTVSSASMEALLILSSAFTLEGVLHALVGNMSTYSRGLVSQRSSETSVVSCETMIVSCETIV